MAEIKHTDFENIIKAVRTLTAGGQPDMNISALLYEHRCFYLLSKLKQPHPYTQALTLDAHINRTCLKERYRQCQEIFSLLESNGIPYAVIKGAVLSVSLYGDPYARHSGDIDLLIKRPDIDTIKKLMLKKGFLQGRVTEDGIKPFTRRELLFQTATSHQAAPFVKHTGNQLCPYINVDINMDIMWGESVQKADMDFVLSQTVQTDIWGITVRKLLPEMEFIAMCLHHYKDMNSIYLLSHGSLHLSLFCDIYYYIKSVHLQAKKLYALCNKLNVSEYVYYCLYYTDLIFDDPSLKMHCKALFSANAGQLLNRFGLADNEFQTWSIDFYERLFFTDLRAYFKQVLSDDMQNKIKWNEENM